MKTKHIEFTTTFKAVEDDEPGTFEALVAVFGNIDKADEVIEAGAFKATLEEKGEFPVIWSHQWLTPPIGVTKSAVETKEGLRVKGRLFVEGDEAVDLAKHVWTAMKAGALKEWSVGLGVKSERFEDRDGRKVTVLEELSLHELGPCLKGVNPETYTASVKAEIDGAKFDEAIAKSTETSSDEDAEHESAARPAGGMTIEQKRQIVDVLLS